jgi:pimeloyl-ACP methyl ester carboxylesterase
MWRDRRVGFAAGAGVAALWGLLAGWWTPRGPLTSGEAIWAIVISFAVGGGAGLVMRSRWAMLVAPAMFAVVFELMRLGTDGPMVDGIQFSFYGLVAFVTGRGFHAVLALLPMLLGAALGAGAGRSLHPAVIVDTPRSALLARRTVAVVVALALVALTLGLARPASTDPIVDANGNEIPGSVAELTTVDINGHDLAMMIRGHSTDNPVLLFLAGGPGGTELGAMRRHLPALEEHFTVVTWDQRGAGKSYPELDPTGTVTLDSYVDDTIAVTNYLRDRFNQNRIYLLGQSWGTTLGVLAVQQQPELYQAFIGTGQMVSQIESDRLFYADTLEWARNTGRTGLVDELEAIGPPPYDDILDYEIALANEQDVYAYDHSPNSEGEAQMSENLIVREYALIDQVHALGAFLDTFATLYPQLQDIDFRETATDFAVPMFFVQGANEADGRAELFNDWYPMIDAPVKDMTVLDTSGHRPLWEQPAEFVDYMVNTVLATTK